MQTLIFLSCEFVHIFSFDLPTDKIKALICRNWPKLWCFMSSAALYKTRQCGRGSWGMIKPQQQTQSLTSKAKYKGFIFAIAAILWNSYSYVLLSNLFIICKPFYPPSSFERTLWVSKAFKSNISTSGSQRLRRMCKFIGVKLGPSSETFWKVEFYFQSSTSVQRIKWKFGLKGSGRSYIQYTLYILSSHCLNWGHLISQKLSTKFLVLYS